MDELFCTNCKKKLKTEDDDKRCPFCGSVEKTRIIKISDKAEGHEFIRLRNDEKINKKYKFEIKFGDDYSISRKKYVDFKMLIDRENNWYAKLVKDKETGEVIRECNEPLKEHIGHGSAKNNKS